MEPKISPQEFDALVARAGLPLSPEQRAALRGPYAFVEAMLARVHAPRPREAEPAMIFRAGDVP